MGNCSGWPNTLLRDSVFFNRRGSTNSGPNGEIALFDRLDAVQPRGSKIHK